MEGLRYLPGVSSLKLDQEACIGCGMCTTVCPHAVFALAQKKAHLVDLDGCMECGACAINCPVKAITVTPGVGCAAYIIKKWLKGTRFESMAGNCC
jgi:ferredoxin